MQGVNEKRYKILTMDLVSNSQGRSLGRSVCLLELLVYLAQRGDVGESGKGIERLFLRTFQDQLKWLNFI